MSFSTAPGASAALAEVRPLAAARDWQAVVRRISALPEVEVYAEPELALHFADGLWRIGRAEQARAVAEEAELRARQRGDQALRLNLTNVVGITLFELGRMEEAEVRFGQLLEHATNWGNDEFAARACNNLGVLANVRGRRDLALTYYQRALAAYQRLGYLRGLAQTHHNLGISYRDLGFDLEADSHYQRAIDFAKLCGSEDVRALAETERAVLRARAGDGPLAESLAQQALHRFSALSDPLGRAEALRVLGAAARVSGQCELAAARLEEAFAIARAHSDPLLHAEVQRDRGLLFRDLQRLDDARAALGDAADHFARLGAEAEATAVRAIAREL